MVRGVGVRDSKDPDGGHVTIGRASFAALLVRAKAGALDLR
ncbi:regulatory protein [Actinomadura verrucosospora]|uniref:Regulatory protein n=1 Tax=Actinomadura verrucosospora TaxID=46165 RepID=A0A7D3W0L4_ACTVE|nr:regulatory protein [Actinomadura verrucosospora]